VSGTAGTPLRPVAADVVAALRAHAAAAPERTFATLIHEDRETRLTYGRFFERGLDYAHHYRTLGVRSGDSVVVILRHSEDLLCAFAGALLAGALPSFMPFPSEKQDPRLYWESHREVFARIGTRVVVTYGENLADVRACLAGADVRVMVPADVPAERAGGPWIWPLIDPDAVAVLQHTSGTTGLKKGVALSHRSILEQLRAYAESLRLTDRHVIASWLPLYHDMGFIACFMLPVVLGVPVVMMDPFEWVYRPPMLLEAIERHRATHAWLPNFAYHHIALSVEDSRTFDLSSLDAVIDCSEPCKPEAFRRFLDAFERSGVRREHLQTCYAMAENVFAVTQSRVGEPVRTLAVDRRALAEGRVELPAPGAPALDLLSVGSPIDGVSVRVLSDGPGAIGEIAISGSSLFSGYYRLPEATAEALVDGWYRTGDLGFLDGGELFVTGRLKDILIINGKNFYAHDLETLVQEVPDVKRGRVVAIAVENEDVGSDEVVILAETEVTDAGRLKAMKRAVKEALIAGLDLYVREVCLVAPGWIVKTTSGKISRKENRAKYLGARAGAAR
jgi:fatty-acyl-CoA synthase